jgi:hypothetical protein
MDSAVWVPAFAGTTTLHLYLQNRTPIPMYGRVKPGNDERAK